MTDRQIIFETFAMIIIWTAILIACLFGGFYLGIFVLSYFALEYFISLMPVQGQDGTIFGAMFLMGFCGMAFGLVVFVALAIYRFKKEMNALRFCSSLNSRN